MCKKLTEKQCDILCKTLENTWGIPHNWSELAFGATRQTPSGPAAFTQQRPPPPTCLWLKYGRWEGEAEGFSVCYDGDVKIQDCAVWLWSCDRKLWIQRGCEAWMCAGDEHQVFPLQNTFSSWIIHISSVLSLFSFNPLIFSQNRQSLLFHFSLPVYRRVFIYVHRISIIGKKNHWCWFV